MMVVAAPGYLPELQPAQQQQQQPSHSSSGEPSVMCGM